MMVSKKEKIGFIGAGNMAAALVKGLLKSGLFEAERIMASDADPQKLKKISDEFGIACCGSNRELAMKSSIIVLSVKPQVIRVVLEEIREEVRADQLVISIAAGVPLRVIREVVGRDAALVRVMPNTPALVQRGMSAVAAGASAGQDHVDAVMAIFGAVGEAIEVPEEMMDSVTALSGSGPGFVFRIMECFVEAGKGLGFDEDASLKLVLQTVLGAAHLACESERTLAELREMVTSPGGTTAAGLAVFDEKGLETMIRQVLEAACKRSVELGKK